MGSRVMLLVLGLPVRVGSHSDDGTAVVMARDAGDAREACAGRFLSDVRAVRCRRAETDLPSGSSFRRELRDACLQAPFLRPVRF